MQELGILKKVDLRQAWKHEALDFTKWLAKDENIALLSEEIGIDINVIQTEASVGSFNVDILAEDSNVRKIVIENQLENTNYDHLGKIITYASGYNAEIIIWIVKEVRNEHKQAIDWLNEHTDENINFFAIKLELLQIGNSKPAPRFQVECKPNQCAKVMKLPNSSLTERKLKLLDFWTALDEYLDNKNSKIKPQKPAAHHWHTISVGTSRAHISLTASAKEHKIGTEFYIPDDKELYYYLEQNREKIEGAFGEELSWQELKDKKASRISVSKDDFEWFEEKSIKFKEAICPFISIN